jgi:hypothetical protein
MAAMLPAPAVNDTSMYESAVAVAGGVLDAFNVEKVSMIVELVMLAVVA